MVLRVLALMMATLPVAANAGADFDYYVLSLSWSPSWCTAEGDDRDADQCRTGARTGFLVHGLWPQYERGWPQDCPARQRDPTRGESAAMSDVMGSGGLAWYQWKKHGRCSGLSGTGYYAITRAATDSVTIPDAFERLRRDVALPPMQIEAAFMAANPAMDPDGITVTCADGALKEVRICLTPDLQPRPCAPDARRDCRAPALLVEGVR